MNSINGKIWHLLVCVLLLFSQAGSGEILKWIDEQGQVHYADQRPGSGRAEVLDLKVSSYEQVSITRSQPIRDNGVVMYSTSWCAYCEQARNYFRKNGIDFTEYDIERNRSAQRAYKKLGARGVPLILVGAQRMNGFSVAGFNRIYPRTD